MSDVNWVSSQEVAEYFNVEVQTVRRWLKEKDIPKDCYVRFGRRYRFDLEKVKQALFDQNDEPGVDDFDEDL